MIDVEAIIYDRISKSLKDQYPDITVTGELISAPTKFPCVSIIELDNATYRKMQTIEKRDNYANLMYQIDIFSNLITGRKSECRNIAVFIDNIMQELGFTRTFLNPIPDGISTSVYRITGRYQCTISHYGEIYRR